MLRSYLSLTFAQSDNAPARKTNVRRIVAIKYDRNVMKTYRVLCKHPYYRNWPIHTD